LNKPCRALLGLKRHSKFQELSYVDGGAFDESDYPDVEYVVAPSKVGLAKSAGFSLIRLRRS